jgi:hypothetical protein
MKRIILYAAIIGLFSAVAQAQNENVNWQTPLTIVGASDVSTNGVYYGSWAPYDGSANTFPVNGVTFEANTDLPSFSASFPQVDQSGYNSFTDPGTANANYNTLLEYATYAGSGSGTIVITWSDLPGHTYLIQAWANDGRGNGRSETFTGGANTSASLDFGDSPGQYIIGTYVADASGSETITLSGADSTNGDYPQINLLQIRDITTNANVTWQTPVTISATSDVSTLGTYYGSWAPYDGNASTLPVNGVTFQASTDLPNFRASFPQDDQSGYTSYTDPGTENANYNTLLESAAYAGSGSGAIVITWSDVPGRTYLIQAWANDGRGNDRSETFAGGTNTSASLNFGNSPGQYIIGTYVANTNGSETITLSGAASANGDYPQINLLQIRDITPSANVTWQTPVTISGTSDVNTNGAYFGSWAPDDVNANSLPVNGVTFQGFSDLPGFEQGPSLDNNYNGFGSPNTSDPDYDALLQYAEYANEGSEQAFFSWSGMTPGDLYLVQFWVNDGRNIGQSRSETITGGANTSAPLSFGSDGSGPGQYIIGTFVAGTNGEETLALTAFSTGTGPDTQINLFQVRSLPFAAEAWDTPTVSPSTNVDAGTVLTISEPLVTGIPPISYQWQANGVNLGGATNSVLTITASNANQSVSGVTNYDLVVANASGTNTSPAVGVTINPASPPGVATNEPAPATLFSGDSVTLNFAVTGTPPLWVEWERDGSPIGTFTNIGESTTTSLTLTALQASQGGIYTVIITNQFGTINSATTSVNYSLTVEPYTQFTWFAPQPITTADAVLELFGGSTNPAVVFEATGFGGDSGAGTAVTLDDGQVITFEQVAAPSFSSPAGAAPGQVATGNGTCFQGDFGTYTGTTGNPTFDDVLNGTDNGVMANLTSMTISNLIPGDLYVLQIFATDDRAANGAPDLIDFQDPNDTANISQSYLLGANDYTLGMFVANATGQTVNMQLPGLTAGGNILDAAVVYSLPSAAEAWDTPTVSPSTNVDAGTVLTISEPLVTGLPPISYQWQANGVNLGGATNSVLTITASNASQSVPGVTNYDLVVANASGTNTSPAVSVTINPASAPGVATNEPAPPTLFSGDSVTLNFAVTGTPPLWVEWERDGSPIGTSTNIGESTTTSLTLTALQASQGGTYTVIVTNQFGTINSATTSVNYSLTVEPYTQFTWFAPQPITTADAVLGLFGGATNVVLEASDFGIAEMTVTLDDGNSINFQQEGVVDSANGTIYTGGPFGTYTGTTGNPSFDAVLAGSSSIMATVTSITFLDLTPGNLYGLQIFATDDRAANGGLHLIDFQDPNDSTNISQSYLEDANDYTLATFVANQTNQTVNMELPNPGGNILDAAVVYSLSSAAEAWDTPSASPSTNVDAGTVLTISEPLVTGLPPILYQWQANGANLDGATNPVLTITATNASHSVSVVTSAYLQ